MASCLVAAVADVALAQDTSGGLSPTRIKLPKGPGSLEGVGENAEAQLNQGQVSYSVPFALPAGQQGLTPSLGLSYSSSGGASVVGLGWSLGGVSAIERMTSRGLPEYDAADLFAAAGGAELARVTGGTSGARLYRERMEQSFSRYTWVDASAAGQGGYWKVETADGRVSYYGARADGTIVPESRTLGRGGAVFAYHLVETVDPFGHRILYDYVLDGGRPYLNAVSWGFETFASDATPRYTASLEYVARVDVLTDAKPGAVVLLARRLSAVRIRVSGQLLRRYQLAYEAYSASSGLSRLASVTTFGTDDVTSNPIVFSFQYSRGLDPACMGTGGTACVRPYRRTVGSIGADIRTNDVDFIDMNGDALPDALDTAGGVHRIRLQQLDDTMSPSWASAVTSTLSGSGSAILSGSEVEMLDLDGDGRSDLVDGVNDRVLRNGGSNGDWRAAEFLDTRLPTMGADVDLRFLDVDYDRQTDVLHMSNGAAWYFRNTGAGIFATSATNVTGLGTGFTSGGLRLADMNGDGMPDAVQFVSTAVWYYPNLGYGEFGAAVVMSGLPSGWVAATTDLVDVSGDGLTDLVQIVGSDVRLAINLDASRFGALIVVQGGDVDGGLPPRPSSTSLRFLDMNANGSTDLVYVSSSGLVEYVELYAERPNLLARVSNGIGKLIDLEYGTIAEHMARDGGAGAASGWPHTLPHPMVVLNSITVTDSRTHVPQVQRMSYRSGYWDSQEHQFRGFEEVWVTTPGDAHVETGEVLHTFDIGVVDRYHRGLPLRVETRSDSRVLAVTTNDWEDCAVAQATQLGTQPVRFVCSTGQWTDSIEGLDSSEAVRTEQVHQYDSYGNKIVVHKLGVVSRGGQACSACTRDVAAIQGEPCGPTCVGDEMHEIVDFIAPGVSTGGRWMLRMPYRKRTFAIDGTSQVAEERTYYDGENLVGLPLGTLTRGDVHRIEQRRELGVEAWRPSIRLSTDMHGNAVLSMDANGHTRDFAHDLAGLLIAHEQLNFDDAGHVPYGLRMELTYHPVLETIVGSTSWMRVEGGAVVSSPSSTAYAYDTLGRIRAIAEPGDVLATPTHEFAYELSDPVSQIVTRDRSVTGSAAPDLESVHCFDGLGRKFEEIVMIEPGRYQVSDRQDFDAHGQAWRQYQTFTTATSGCTSAIPTSDVLATDSRRDARGRTIAVQHPDAAEHGGVPSYERTVFRPLITETWDSEDTNATGPYANTPSRSIRDGLDRLLREEQSLTPNDVRSIRLSYDWLGRLRSLSDDAGNEQSQRYDLLGRVIETNHPDSSASTYAYDDANTLVSRTDARGLVTRYAYDEANRIVAMWDPERAPESTVSYRYDGNCAAGPTACPNGEGRLVEIAHSVLQGQAAREHTLHDARGLQVGRVVTRGSRTYSFTNAYDNANRLRARTFPDTTTVAFSLDGTGRVVGIPGHVDEFSYDDRGQLVRSALANGVVTSRGFDSRVRLRTLVSLLPTAGSAAQDVTLNLDREGNLVGVSDHRPLSDLEPSEGANYEYDSLYRLISATLDPARTPEETISYSYDRVDNLVGIDSSLGAMSAAHVGELSYGQNGAGPHSVTTVGSDPYTYDVSGQVTERAGLNHTWDFLGRLVSSRRIATDEITTETAYGAGWTRSEQSGQGHATEYVAPDYEVRDGIATIYVRENESTIARIERAASAPLEMPDYTLDGRIGVADAWLYNAKANDIPGVVLANVPVPTGPQVDVDVMLASAAARLLLGPDGSARTFEHADHLGTVTAETNEDGAIVQRALAYPFGTPRYEQGSGWSRHGYTGMERDVRTGLQLHGARWLDPRAGRWASPDPFARLLNSSNIHEASTSSAYADNRPTFQGDPSGMCGAPCVIALIAAIGMLENDSEEGGAGRVAVAAVSALPTTRFVALAVTVTSLRDDTAEGGGGDVAIAIAMVGVGRGTGRAINTAAAEARAFRAARDLFMAETATANALRLVNQFRGSVTSSLPFLNRLRLPQSRVVEVLTDMYRRSGRGIAGVQRLPNGSQVLISRRIGTDQAVAIVGRNGRVRIGTADISPVIGPNGLPTPTVVATNIRQ